MKITNALHTRRAHMLFGMCNTSSESCHWGDGSLRISSLPISQIIPKGFP